MSLNGLEKITDRILAEAQAKADKILADADAECQRITAEYTARADAIKDALADEAEREGMEHVARVKANAATKKRNLLLQTKSDLIDDVFKGALEGTQKLDGDRYVELLAGLLSAAMLEQLDTMTPGFRMSTEKKLDFIIWALGGVLK